MPYYGGSPGGAAASGLQAGFDMGLRATAAEEARKQREFENARQTTADTQRADQLARSNARQDKTDAQSDEDRALTGLNANLEDARYQLGALHAQYGDQPIPDTEAKPLYGRVGDISNQRQALIAKRYQPVIDATQQKWRDFASKAQVGQADPNTLRGKDLRDFIKATTGHDLSDFANGTVGGAINDATAGVATNNGGMTVRAAGTLLGPQIRQGLGGTAPDGSQIVDKSLAALVPAPAMGGGAPTPPPVQGLGAALTAATAPVQAGNVPPVGEAGLPKPAVQGGPPPLTPGSNPGAVLPVLQVTTRQPDGRLTTYHAPVTQGRGTDPNEPLAQPLQVSDLMDRMGRLGVVDNWLKTPEMTEAVQDALKSSAPTTFEQAWGLVHGDPKVLAAGGVGAADPTSVKIAAIRKLANEQGLSFAEAASAVAGHEGAAKRAGGVGAAVAAPAASGASGTGLPSTQVAPAEQAARDAEAVKVIQDERAKAVARLNAGDKTAQADIDAFDKEIAKLQVPTPAAAPAKGGAAPAASSAALGGATAPTAPDKAVDFWARAVIAGDKDWQVGLSRNASGSKLIEAVKRRVPELAAEMGLDPQDMGTTRAQNAALGATLKDLTKRSAAVELFSSKLQKDMGTFDALLDKASTGSPLLISKPINYLRRQFSDPDLAQLDLAAKQVGTEYERLITGGTLSVAQLHATAAEDAKALINGDMPPAQARALMKTMLVEMNNARTAASESTDRISDQMRALGRGRGKGGTGLPGAAPTAPAAGAAGAAPAGAPKRIANDADYNALPSGATFIAPDGSTRRKP